MNAPALLRFTAISGILSGLLLAVPGVLDGFFGESTPTSILLSFSPALSIPLVVALYSSQATKAGDFGMVAYAINIVGTGLFAGVAFSLNAVLYFLDDAAIDDLRAGPTGVLLSVNGGVFVIGSILFGVSMIRARVHSSVAAWAFTLGVPALAIAAKLPESPGTAAAHACVGGSLIALSYGLWSAAAAAQRTSNEEALMAA